MESVQNYLHWFLISIIILILCISSSTLRRENNPDIDKLFGVVPENVSVIIKSNQSALQSTYIKSKPVPFPTNITPFLAYIESLQSNCSTPVYYLEAWNAGFGSMMNVAMEVAVNAWLKGFRVSFPPSNETDEALSYYDGDICGKEHNVFSCFYKPLHRCNDSSMFVYEKMYWDNVKQTVHAPLDMFPHAYIVSDQATYKQAQMTSEFFYQIYRYSFKPREALQGFVDTHINKILALNISSAGSSYACVHLRGDEKADDGVNIVTVKDFAKATVDRLLESEPIFLMAETKNKADEFISHLNEMSRGTSHVIIKVPQVERGALPHMNHVGNLLASMQFCSKARFAVGTLSSNIGRLILIFHQAQNTTSASMPWFTSMDYRLTESFHPSTGYEWLFDNGKQDLSNAVWHIPTQGEGLVSHYYQLESIWDHAQRYGRRVVELIDRSSSKVHYKGFNDASICDVFVFPISVSCSNRSYTEVCREKGCTVIEGWASNISAYNLTDMNIDIKSISWPRITWERVQVLIGYYPPRQSLMHTHFSLKFTEKYNALYKIMKNSLGIQYGKPLVVVHWRREDELTVRCSSAPGGWEHSINCAKNVSDFINLVHQITGTNTTSARNQINSFIYVATNEESIESLIALKEAGFHTFNETLSNLSSTDAINMFDQFVLELMLMCDSDWFFSWGITRIARLVKDRCSGIGKQRIVEVEGKDPDLDF